MKNAHLLILLLATFSACNKKIVLLPEIQTARITDVIDVSPAYLFYDETQTDSVELNRKNLISTTNWLVNVDKRLTLKQAIPHIKFLQEKKRNAKMHKNESAKNYYTCNDTSNKNLGFIEFTDVVYLDEITKYSFEENSESTIINFTKKNIIINDKSVEIENIKMYLKDLNTTETELILNFNSSLTFQDYIHYKSLLLELDIPNVSISNEEFIY